MIIGGPFLSFSFKAAAQSGEPDSTPPTLSDAFGDPPPASPVPTQRIQVEKEVEPIVLGRRKWSERPAEPPVNDQPAPAAAKSAAIEELDPLETQQPKSDKIEMPGKPALPAPAVNIHRNFEGTLVLKPRTLGFQRDFPFQLENARGKRLAFIDVENVRIIDPLEFKDKKVNVLGKLEAIKEGSDELVIRARLLRKSD